MPGGCWSEPFWKQSTTLAQLAPEEMAWLEAFSEFMRDLQQAVHPAALYPVITTNYDMASDGRRYGARDFKTAQETLESRTESRRGSISVCSLIITIAQDNDVKVRRPNSPIVSLYKLHGSANWLRCPSCDRVYVNRGGQFWKRGAGTRRPRGNTCACSRPGCSRRSCHPRSPGMCMNRICHQFGTMRWRRADSENWILIGYSFPDENIRACGRCFTRAYGARTVPPKIGCSIWSRRLPALQHVFEPSSLQYTEVSSGAFSMLMVTDRKLN